MNSVTRLRSYPTPDGSEFQPTILEAALATTAAPTYFSEVKIRGTSFVDGAIGANNPAGQVESEARELWCQDGGNLQPLVKCFVSIGTGHKGTQSVSDKGLKHLIKALEREALQTDTTHQNFLENWRRRGDANKYFRFNVEYGLDRVSLAEYQEQDQIQAATVSYMEKHAIKEELQACVSNLRLKECR
jgi:patatin-like phospholipase/acyl hydrolase